MKKLSLFLAVTLCSLASMATDFTGTLKVTVNGNVQQQNATISIDQNNGNYNLLLKNFVYDYIKSVTVKPGLLPQIDDCWNNKMGICQDLAAMTCAMLRSQGVPARLMIGTVGSNTYHAWVVAVVNGKNEFFDPTAELNASSKTDSYTTERYY